MKTFIFLVLTLATQVAEACDDVRLQFMITSYHVQSDWIWKGDIGKPAKKYKYNTDNHGLGVECDVGPVTYYVGWYRNSFENDSVFGAVSVKMLELTTESGWSAETGPLAGGATGYRSEPDNTSSTGEIAPILGLVTSLVAPNDSKVSLLYVPNHALLGQQYSDVIALSVSIPTSSK